MNLEEDRPQNLPKPERDLDPMSIEELQEYIEEIEGEIERVRREIAKKEAHSVACFTLRYVAYGKEVPTTRALACFTLVILHRTIIKCKH